MTKIKLNWQYAKGELETGTLKMLCIPARGKRIFGEDEMDAELCIKDQWNLSIAKIHLGDVESSNILCEEIASVGTNLRNGMSVKKIRMMYRNEIPHAC